MQKMQRRCSVSKNVDLSTHEVAAACAAVLLLVRVRSIQDETLEMQLNVFDSDSAISQLHMTRA